MKLDRHNIAVLLTVFTMILIVFAFVSVIFFKKADLFGWFIGGAFLMISTATIVNPFHN